MYVPSHRAPSPSSRLHGFHLILRPFTMSPDTSTPDVSRSSISLLRGPDEPAFLRNELLHEIFEESVRRRPHAIAVKCGDESWTYEELNCRANQLAHYLRRRGGVRGCKVLLWMPRGLEMYAAFLGILKCGGCYVPMDPDFPADRVLYAMEDSHARFVLTTSAQAASLPESTPMICLDKEPDIALQPRVNLPRHLTEGAPEDAAYIIYTSGSTGRPKGVQVPHRAVCHFVRSEGSILGLRETDMVFQGFSLSFDMSIEEIWPAFHAGASLLVATKELMRAAPELSKVLARHGVTVWSAVPTLLGMQEHDIPSLRLLNLGGEACPSDLVRRWSRPGRRILNTYGPSETAVTATWAEVFPDQPVTIGQPLPNYFIYLVNEDLRPVERGVAGEICVGGPGLAHGYVNRDDLTRQQFVHHPSLGRLYRTGDLGCISATGDLEFLGRIDTQVKIRGYRVELNEIESVLAEDAALQAAVVRLWKHPQGADILVAYVVPRPGRGFDPLEARQRLGTRLPTYMVPSLFETLEELPVLPSGKIDRKRLPDPTLDRLPTHRASVEPVMESERHLLKAWEKIFAPLPVSVTDDFFTDLGGDSLRAAILASEIREMESFTHMSIGSLYEYPTVQKLARHLGATAPDSNEEEPIEDRAPVSRWRHLACAAAQALSLPVIYGFFSLQALVPFLSYAILTSVHHWSSLAAGAASLGCFLLTLYSSFLIVICVKWTVLGRTRPGRHPLWGAYYFRWWLVNRFLHLVPVDYLSGTPLLNLYFRLLGAEIGENVKLSSTNIDVPDLVSIGADSVFGYQAALTCAHVQNGWLEICPIEVGIGCHIGTNALVNGGSRLGDGAALDQLSMLSKGEEIPERELWSGSPAQSSGIAVHSRSGAGASGGTVAKLAKVAGYLLLSALLAICAIAPVGPGMALLMHVEQISSGFTFLLLTPVVALSFVMFMALELAALKWLIVGRLKPGRYAVHGSFYVRWWFVDKLMELSLDILKPIYATLYLAPWYRMLGVRLGARAEVSTASGITLDLLSIGQESFIADAVVLGVPVIDGDHLVLQETEIAARAFVGNSALVPAGASIGEDVLIGCLSVPPKDAARASEKGSSWFGIPALYLPQRAQEQQFDEGATFRPPVHLVLQRLAIEGIRIILPLTVLIALNSLLIVLVSTMATRHEVLSLLLLFPLCFMGAAAAAGAFVVFLKWLVIGRYRPAVLPLWNRFVWCSELVTSTYENLAVPLVCELLKGTPFLPMYWRLLGAKFGRRVFCDTTDITEFDMVSVGDDTSLNWECGLQTHLFEDRVMKISTVRVGASCSVGSLAIALYDSEMQEGATLEGLSILMKGETLPPRTSWIGSPARKCRRTTPSNSTQTID